MPTNHLGQQTTDSGHVITESERIAEDIRQLLVNNNPDGLMELGSDDVKALTDYVMSHDYDDWYDGYRQGYAKAKEEHSNVKKTV